MEQHHDEHIDCADCGASFVFSADEAAVFAGRGLTAPKRCKDCRRARKERAASEGQGGPRRPGAFGAREGSFGARDGNQAPRPYGNGNAPQAAGRWNGPPRGAAPRYGAQPRQYTGDVNEYRSPMQDGTSGASTGMPPRRFAPPQGDYRGGEYRSPMPDGNNRRGPRAQAPAPGAPRFRDDRRSRPAARSHGAGEHAPAPEADTAQQAGPHPAANKRRRPQAEMFPVTCNACGAQAEVPFKPAEGREVFCPTCYRARRPA